MAGFNLHSTGFVALLGGSGPVTPPAGSVDKTRYLFFGTAAGAGNTATQWLDESGHGKHLTAPAATLTLGTSVGGKPAYVMNAGSRFNTPFAGVAPQTTVYALLTLGTDTQVYFFSSDSNQLLLGIHSTDIGPYNESGYQQPVPLPSYVNRALLVWRLDSIANTGRVYVDGELVFSGPYAPRATPASDTGVLGSYYAFNYATFQGSIEAFAIRNGPESDADVAATSAALLAL